jgi:coenzyme F420 hydrogenase subunit beta
VHDPADVAAIRYRGHGWPGPTSVDVRTAAGLETRTLSYEEAWGEVLTNDKQWRCHVCADHSGEFADIAVGDPWHQPPTNGDPGRSLIVVRTERGRRLLTSVRAGGAITLGRSQPHVLADAQPNLLRGRGAVWGRLLACRLLGLPVPRYRGLPMFRFWIASLTLTERARSVLGTIRRARRRGLRRRVTLDPLRSPAPSISPRAFPRATTSRRAA